MLPFYISHFAVFFAAIASTIVGAFWFSSLAFGNIEPSKGVWLSNVGTFLSMVVRAYVLAYLIARLGIDTIYGGIGIAALFWLGFEATILIGAVFWDAKSFKWYFIHAGQHLAVLVLIGVILVWFG